MLNMHSRPDTAADSHTASAHAGPPRRTPRRLRRAAAAGLVCAAFFGTASLWSGNTLLDGLAAQARASRAISPSPYGVIEIGSKGVKAYVFNLGYAMSNPQCSATNEAYRKCLNPTTLPQYNVNAIDPAQIQPAADAVVSEKKQLMDVYHVPESNIYTVASSGIDGAEHLSDLRAAVDARLSADRRMDAISANEEATYAFHGLMAMLPAQYEAEREQEAIIVDFGSGNVKGSFEDLTAPGHPLITFSLPYGTKTFTQDVNKDLGSGDFVSAAERYRDTTVLPQVRSLLDSKPGARTQPRVYIIGGIVWALSNLTRPQDKQAFAPVKQEDIDSLYTQVTAPNGDLNLCANNPAASYNKDIKNICNTFDTSNRISGLLLVKSFANELDFPNKCVFFFRDSLYAWPMGYLRAKVNGANDQINRRVHTRRPYHPSAC